VDTRQLDNFLAVYDTRSTHAAAERLYISQQGLSRSIRSLEAELGVRLFERTSSGMVPTPAGERFRDYALRARRDAELMRAEVRSASDGLRELTVVCSYGTLYLALDLFHDFESSHPGIRLRWLEQVDRQAESTLLDGRAEMGLVVRNPRLPELEFHLLWSFSHVVLAYEGHPLYRRDSVTYADLRDQPIAFEGPDFNVNAGLVSRCLAAGFTPRVAAETSDMSLCLHLCAHRECLSVVPEFVARAWPMPGTRAIPLDDPTYLWEMGVAWPRDRRPEGPAADLASYLMEHRDELGSVPGDNDSMSGDN
jgi:DNA-binding transcriptional LysR family regulator